LPSKFCCRDFSAISHMYLTLSECPILQVLILGYGNIGKELAIRLRPFGVKILAIKRSWTKKVNPLNGYRDGIEMTQKMAAFSCMHICL